MKTVKICPRCNSLNIGIRWQSFWFVGFPATYMCNNCGYKGFFPYISEEDLKKLEARINKKNKLKNDRIKRKMD